MPKFDAGKWAEKQAQLWLEAASARDSSLAFHRFPDARAARGALAAQPSDFLISKGTPGGFNRTIYLEVKETAQIRRLPKAKVGQYGMLKKFYWTNAEVLVAVYMSEYKNWVYLQANQDVDDLFYFDECPPSFDLAHLEHYPTINDILREYLLCA